MKFDEAKEKISTIHKLHTARDFEGETIFYKKPFSAKRITVLTDEKTVFDLDKVTHMSLGEIGLLIQYKPVNVIKTYPFPLNNIKDNMVLSMMV